MALKAGRLRHRVRIQQTVESQDPDTGEILNSWQTIPGCESVPAAIEPLSVKEFIAAQAINSKINARIVIRYRPGMNAKLRIIHGSKVYDPAGFLPDQNSGLEYLTSPVELLEEETYVPPDPSVENAVVFNGINVTFNGVQTIFSGAP